MKTGTKSLLFGVHQFIWHPVTVLAAWCNLYGRPPWREMICIIIHDWGYWGAPNMDGEEGERHPELGASLAGRLFDTYHWFAPFMWHKEKHAMFQEKGKGHYYRFCLHHSRHYARRYQKEPSKLCWADKLSIMYEPWWLYLPRAWASGELAEYRALAVDYVPLTASHRVWYSWVQGRLAKLAEEQRGDAVPYVNPKREV